MHCPDIEPRRQRRRRGGGDSSGRARIPALRRSTRTPDGPWCARPQVVEIHKRGDSWAASRRVPGRGLSSPRSSSRARWRRWRVESDLGETSRRAAATGRSTRARPAMKATTTPTPRPTPAAPIAACRGAATASSIGARSATTDRRTATPPPMPAVRGVGRPCAPTASSTRARSATTGTSSTATSARPAASRPGAATGRSAKASRSATTAPRTPTEWPTLPHRLPAPVVRRRRRRHW